MLEIGQTVSVKVLDIDRERQRISLGLKQTQSDPWQQVLDSYGEGDVVEGRVTKVVTFGAFVEILPGVEGLVHISELANHHVENPREVVSQGDPVNVLILEIDGDRRRLSLSLKRVEEGAVPVPRADGGESVHSMPDLRLSEEAFPTTGSTAAFEDVEVAPGAEDEIVEGTLAEQGAPEAETADETQPVAEAEAEAEPAVQPEVVAEPEAAPEAEAAVEPEPAGRRRARGRCRAEADAEPEAANASDDVRPKPPRRTGRRTGLVRRPIAVAITGGIGAGKSTALDAFRAHGAATVSSDEIVHHLLATDDDVRDALVARLGKESLGADGRPDRARVAQAVFGDRKQLEWLEGLLHPLVSREYLQWREQLAGLDDPPLVCVTEVPLLYEVGADERFDKVVVITAPTALREQRRRVARDDRDSRLLPDREKVRRADFHYVNTGSFEDLGAWVGAVMQQLTAEAEAETSRPREAARVRRAPRRGGGRRCGGVGRHLAAGVVRADPVPAPLRGDRADAREELRPAAGAPRRRHLHGEQVRRVCAFGRGRGRPDAAPARDCEGHRDPDRRSAVRRERPARPRDQRPLRLVVPAEPPRPLRRRSSDRPRRVPRGTRERRRPGGGGGWGSSFPKRART